MDSIQIDFNKPCLVGNELAYIAQTFEKSHISGDGYFSKKCHQLIESELNVPKVLLTTSCTHALEMAALCLDIQPGDEVIVPSFTFVSTINAFVLRGAVPVFVDIRPDTLNIDEMQLEQHITPRTKAIVVVHYAGVSCEMDAILGIANRHNIPVIEDNAHGLFGKYKGKYLGTFGCMATQSFHETKNITCGEGGALLINDSQYIERAEIIREKGTNRSRFFQGLIDRYTWVDVGSSYLPSDILAAVLYAQLERWVQIQQKRKQIWEYYYQNLNTWAETHGVKLPTVPASCDQAYHMFYMVLPSNEIRKMLMAHLRERGIVTVFHYLPLHLSEYGRRFGGKPGDCPVTEMAADRLLRLPFYYDLSENDLDQVISGLYQFEY
ncbi:MAG: dTDP-4-amino-4,6-dideoxygalactose transaminase [Anaerolineaceae bacterium]|nr:dTDP-4-amino-4,6-dideoxygalactose transaminase [Anaerolineaceae bacterium]